VFCEDSVAVEIIEEDKEEREGWGEG